MTSRNPTPTTTPIRPSTKIQNRHRDRVAIVYVRQSTPHQVLENRESRERQYALTDTAVALGWSRERVRVIDDDQGLSGKSAEQRVGFQQLLTEITLSHVGIVLSLEMSRLARSCKDWHQLLEVCALVGTLLGDQDGVYDPNDTNDRLLLGLKGSMSEFELVTIRNRLERGKLNKARRCELFQKVPFGYVKLSSEEVALDPDEQVQSVIRLVFDRFDELGSLYALFHDLIRQKIKLGMRVQDGPRRGELIWQRPTLPTLNHLMHNPIYAGAYGYGRLPSAARRRASDQPPAQRLPLSEWTVFERDRLPAYISWDRFEANQRRLADNRSTAHSPGTPRAGVALLAGVLVCGTCGYRMRVSYRSASTAHYSCERHLQVGIPKTCYGLRASSLDAVVAEQVLRALEPASLELSLATIANLERDRERLHKHWKQRLERSQYEVDRIERQYQACEPENRLVTRTLEQRWEQALAQHRELTDEYERFVHAQPPQLAVEQREQIRSLAWFKTACFWVPVRTFHPLARRGELHQRLRSVQRAGGQLREKRW